MNCLGFYMWSKNKNGKTGDAKARSLTKKQLAILFVAVCVAVAAYTQILTLLGGKLALLDSIATVFVFTAILMQVSRYAEMWLMFIFSNTANLVVWAALLGTDPSAPTMVAMWACYILNACFGFYNWRKLAKSQQQVENPALEAEFEGAVD
jgi:nicotinamide mononucleotide transporter